MIKQMLNLGAIQREHCPVLLTSLSEIGTQRNIIKIQQILGLHLAPIFNNINKFPSYRPYYISDCMYFPQQYLIVYQNLGSSNRSQ